MAINTVNELLTGKVKFTLLQRKTSELTKVAQIAALRRFSAKSLTLDNGTEHMEHETVTCQTKVPIYFADPYCSGQRGANENVNMLLRGYLPKRVNICDLTQGELDDIAEELNNRPRKRLGYLTPNEKYQFLNGGSSVALDFRM